MRAASQAKSQGTPRLSPSPPTDIVLKKPERERNRHAGGGQFSECNENAGDEHLGQREPKRKGHHTPPIATDCRVQRSHGRPRDVTTSTVGAHAMGPENEPGARGLNEY